MEKFLNQIRILIPKKIFTALQPTYHFLMSWLSALIFWFPSEKLIVIGVTGTTGKTTTVYLIAKILEANGYKVGYTSTAMLNNGEKEWLNDKKMTMIGRFFTQRILRKMVKNKCQYAIVETTSQGVEQFRHKFINYDILVFTGLYPEHIEAHGGFENYKKAKGKLFSHLKKCKTKYSDDKKNVYITSKGIKKIELNRVKKTIIANGDDEYAPYFLDFWAEDKIIYSENIKNNFPENLKEVIATDVNIRSNGVDFKIDDLLFRLNIMGGFNVPNSLAAICVSLTQGISLEMAKFGLEKIKNIAGRMERIDEGQNFSVIIDYAFEPRAVEKLYDTIKNIPHNKIIHMLGSAGGGRDIARRPILGSLAGKNADYVIVTNEDPYDDDPKVIINEVSAGAIDKGKIEGVTLFKILDRKEAIKKAISLAGENDIILITGKGSEQAICISEGKKIPWDDRLVVREVLKNLYRI